MRVSRHFFTALAAALFQLAFAAAAQATEARATTWVNVRSGPGTGYGVLDVMAKGETGTLSECRSSGWCYVRRPGPDGWVSSTYLTAIEESADPNCSFRLVIGSGGPRFAIVCGSGTVVVPGPYPGPRPFPRPDPFPIPGSGRDQACFYDRSDFSGAQFCRGPGLYNTMPWGFDNRVSSVRLYGRTTVRLCENRDMGGYCRTLNASEDQLGTMLDNRGSSFRVFAGDAPALKQVCLFDGTSYTGDFLCFREGIHRLPASFQARASSIRLYGGARPRLSKNEHYGIGEVLSITSSRESLPVSWDNRVRSLRVE